MRGEFLACAGWDANASDLAQPFSASNAACCYSLWQAKLGTFRSRFLPLAHSLIDFLPSDDRRSSLCGFMGVRVCVCMRAAARACCWLRGRARRIETDCAALFSPRRCLPACLLALLACAAALVHSCSPELMIFSFSLLYNAIGIRYTRGLAAFSLVLSCLFIATEDHCKEISALIFSFFLLLNVVEEDRNMPG